MSMGTAQIIQHRVDGMVDNIPGVPQVSLVFMDPPYNIGVQYEDDVTKDKLTAEQYESFCECAIWTGAQHLKPGGTLWWLCPSSHMDFIPRLLARHVGRCVYRIVKQETFSQYQQKTLTDDYRMLFCYQKPSPCGGGLTFNPDAIRIPSDRQEKYGDKRADPRGRVPGQVWKIRRLQGTSADHVDWHKCQLPPELYHRIVSGWSSPGDNLLELFAGSGTMGKISTGLGRNYFGVDQSPTYVGKMKERLGL